ncbi:MAG: GAF domain-containing protein [Anaerolineae bacterium]|nr:GAF domain-containing protein [Anaerolineae bacterium]
MSSRMQNQFSTEETAGERERQSTVQMLRAIAIVTVVATVAVLISEGIVGGRAYIVATLVPVGLFILASLFLLGRGVLWPSRFLIPIVILGVLTYLISEGGGTHDVAMIAYAVVLILASLTLGRRAPLIFSVLVIGAAVVIGILEMNGTIVNQGSFMTEWEEIILFSIFILVIAGLQWLLIGRMNESLDRARRNEQAQIQANRELRELQVALENRVEQRTRELAQRSRYLEATAQVAREAASTLEVGQLLSRVANLVGEQFGFYHTGIFMLDGSGEWVELQAASSEGGRRMLARRHRLRVADQGMVGYVANRGQARIALDTGTDAVFMQNPDLPETRSEMALPLRARGQIIGVLDVQSAEAEAFTEQDLATLQTLADQIALAISNAQLFQQAQASIESERRAYGELSREAWQQLAQGRTGLAYRSHQGVVRAAGEEPEPVPDAVDLPTLDIPIRVRGQVIGTIQARKPDPGGEWAADESETIETLAEQLSTALEGARLYQDTQQRAAREQVIGEVTGRIRESLDMDTILQTAIREIGEALNIAEVEVQMGRSTRDGEQ